MREISRLPEILPPEKIEGAPQDEAESIFLSTPALSSAADFCIHYKKANGKERQTNLREAAEEFLKSPAKLIAFLDALAFLEDTQARAAFYEFGPEALEGKNATSDIYQSNEVAAVLTEQLEYVKLKEIPLTPELAYEWLLILTESPLYAPLAEKVLTRYAQRCQTPKAAVDFFYNLLLVVGQTQNTKIINKILEIRAFATNIASASSNIARDLILSLFDSDDENLRRALEVDGFTILLTHTRAKHLTAVMEANQAVVNERPDFLEAIERLDKKDRGRLKAIVDFHNNPDVDENGMGKFDETKPFDWNKFPNNLLKQPGPLRELLNRYIAETLGDKEHRAYPLDFYGANYVMRLDEGQPLCDLIAGCLKKESADHPPLTEHKHWKTLALLAPEELTEQDNENKLKDELNADNEKMRQEMKYDTRYLLSPRGDLVEITDPILRDTLGLENILYEIDRADKQHSVVTITVLGHKYQTRLDENFILREADTTKELILPKLGVFVENVILSHLHAIRCSNEVNEITDKKGSADNGNGRKAFTSRRGFSRTLPEGQSPTAEQIARSLEEHGIDLIRLNAEREAAGLARKKTFVFPVEKVAIGGSTPIHSKAPDATAHLQAILSKAKTAMPTP